MPFLLQSTQRRSSRFRRAASLRWAALITLLALAGSMAPGRKAEATIMLQAPDPKLHDRFYVGVDKAFIGDPYDWSGVGKNVAANAWGTMISESYFLTATHRRPAINDTMRWHGDNDAAGQFIERTVVSGTQIAGTDLWLGKLSAPINQGGEPTIAIYPLATFSAPSGYNNLPIYTMGQGTGTTVTHQRLGRNIIDPGTVQLLTEGPSSGLIYTYDFLATGGVGADESLLVSGDSGAPSMAVIDGQLALVGIHWVTSSGVSPPFSGDTLVGQYINQINAVMAADGQSVVVVPEPGSWLLLATGGLLLFACHRRRFSAGRAVR